MLLQENRPILFSKQTKNLQLIFKWYLEHQMIVNYQILQ